MTRIFATLSIALTLWAGGVSAQFEVGTTFNYQGSLNQAGAPATGDYDFEFALFDAENDGIEVAPAVAVDNLAVEDGLFSVPLDFGSVFDGASLYLEIRVREADDVSGDFATLQPRQSILPTPYAMFANRAGSTAAVDAGSVTTESIASGAVNTDKLSAEARSTLAAADGDPAIAVSVDANGDATANSDLAVTGNLSADTLNVTNAISAQTLTTSAAINANSANITGTVAATTVDASGTVDADTVDAGTVNAGAIAVVGASTSNSVVTSQLQTDSIDVRGAELRLGTNDGIPVGSNPDQRALSHAANDVLNVNVGGDFEGGTVITGNAHVTGNISLDGVLTGRVVGGAYVACTGNGATNLSCTAWGEGQCGTGSSCVKYQCASGTLRTISSATECYASGQWGRSCYSMLCVE